MATNSIRVKRGKATSQGHVQMKKETCKAKPTVRRIMSVQTYPWISSFFLPTGILRSRHSVVFTLFLPSYIPHSKMWQWNIRTELLAFTLIRWYARRTEFLFVILKIHSHAHDFALCVDLGEGLWYLACDCLRLLSVFSFLQPVYNIVW